MSRRSCSHSQGNSLDHRPSRIHPCSTGLLSPMDKWCSSGHGGGVLHRCNLCSWYLVCACTYLRCKPLRYHKHRRQPHLSFLKHMQCSSASVGGETLQSICRRRLLVGECNTLRCRST